VAYCDGGLVVLCLGGGGRISCRELEGLQMLNGGEDSLSIEDADSVKGAFGSEECSGPATRYCQSGTHHYTKYSRGLTRTACPR
jgi:hypothetical protein